jgi:hypothetical protein
MGPTHQCSHRLPPAGESAIPPLQFPFTPCLNRRLPAPINSPSSPLHFPLLPLCKMPLGWRIASSESAESAAVLTQFRRKEVTLQPVFGTTRLPSSLRIGWCPPLVLSRRDSMPVTITRSSCRHDHSSRLFASPLDTNDNVGHTPELSEVFQAPFASPPSPGTTRTSPPSTPEPLLRRRQPKPYPRGEISLPFLLHHWI